MRKEYDDEDEIPERRHSSGKKKKKFGWVNVLTILLVVVLVVLVGVYAVINHYYSKSNYVSDDKITINKSTEVETESTGLTDEETDALQSEILNETQDIELPNNNNVYNILLIGVDRRDKTWYGNSDSMILMSINKDTKQIHMTSFMRDLYANIPDVGVKKLNAACAYGGGPLVVRTIEDNYKLPIDNYASVDLDSMIDIINNIRSYDSIISWFKHFLITRYPFPASMIMNISILIKTLIKSNYAFERFVGIIFAILMIQVCMVFIYVIVSGLIIPLGKLLIILFRGDTL